MSVVIETGSPEETERVAERLGARLAGGEVILLSGTLGAGKTCFVRGLAAGLGIPPRGVKSPSYNILHQYDGGRRVLQHFDAYFVRESEEFFRAGLDDFLADGDVVAVEWAERYRDEFPADAISVRLELPEGASEEEARRVTIEVDPAPEWLTALTEEPSE